MPKTGPKTNYKLTTDIVRKLEQAFAIGANITLACNYGGISRDSYYRWIKENPELSDRFEQLRSQPILASLQAIVTAIKNGDVKTAKWYLERKLKAEFGLHTGPIPYQPEKKELSEERKQFLWSLLNRNLVRPPKNDYDGNAAPAI